MAFRISKRLLILRLLGIYNKVKRKDIAKLSSYFDSITIMKIYIHVYI